MHVEICDVSCILVKTVKPQKQIKYKKKINKHNIFYQILVLWWEITGKCAKSYGCCQQPAVILKINKLITTITMWYISSDKYKINMK